MTLRTIIEKDRRLVILRSLQEDDDYSLNESLLAKVLEAYAHGVPRDVLRADLAWLAEQGLVTVDDLPRPGKEPLMVAKLTSRGADVAEGRARVPGVARPTPGG